MLANKSSYKILKSVEELLIIISNIVRKSKLKIAFEATPQNREVNIFVVIEHHYRTGDFHLPSLLEFPVLTFA